MSSMYSEMTAVETILYLSNGAEIRVLSRRKLEPDLKTINIETTILRGETPEGAPITIEVRPDSLLAMVERGA